MSLFSTLVPLSGQLPADHARVSIPDGYAGTAVTIEHMQKMVSYGKRERDVRALALKLIYKCPSKDFSCYTRAIYRFVSSLKYVFDPVGVEALVSPLEVIKMGGGDCDDLAMLLCALLEVVGIRCEYETLRADKSKPDEFTHVYVRARVPGQGWIYLDPTMPDKGFGWRPPQLNGVKDWPSSLDSPEDHGEDTMKGLSAVMDFGTLCGLGTPAEDAVALYYMLRSKGADKAYPGPMLRISTYISQQNWELANGLARQMAWVFFNHQDPDVLLGRIPSQVVVAEDPIGSLYVTAPPRTPTPQPEKTGRPSPIFANIPWYVLAGAGVLAFMAFSGRKA